MEFADGGVTASHVTGAPRVEAIPDTCLQCNVEDGGLAFIENGRVVNLEGSPKHPGNRSKLCAKGNAGVNQLYAPDRILYPMRRVGKRGEGKGKGITWEEAYQELAARMNEVLDRAKAGKGSPNEIALPIGRTRGLAFSTRFMDAIGS